MIAGRYRYVVVEGPIGAGKTSLARKLAQALRGPRPVLEQPEENPFLARFYRTAHATRCRRSCSSCSSACSNCAELQQLDLFRGLLVRATSCSTRIPLFARLTLADDELKLYEQIHAQLGRRRRRPTL